MSLLKQKSCELSLQSNDRGNSFGTFHSVTKIPITLDLIPCLVQIKVQSLSVRHRHILQLQPCTNLAYQ